MRTAIAPARANQSWHPALESRQYAVTAITIAMASRNISRRRLDQGTSASWSGIHPSPIQGGITGDAANGLRAQLRAPRTIYVPLIAPAISSRPELGTDWPVACMRG